MMTSNVANATPTKTALEKVAIRERMAQLRAELSLQEHKTAAARLFTKVQPYLSDFVAYLGESNSGVGNPAKNTVLVYSALAHELSLQPVIDELWSRGARVVFPKVTGAKGDRELTLYAVAGESELAPGAFGVLEPIFETAPIDPREIDLALIPGVAFTREGARLGYGGGYYDTLLTQLREDCPTVGVCFDFQLVEELPLEPHDLPVDEVLYSY